jgi:hypothetical protein
MLLAITTELDRDYQNFVNSQTIFKISNLIQVQRHLSNNKQSVQFQI